MSSPTVKPSKEGSHSARESTSRLARDEEANDEEAGKNRRERNSQDLKKTLSTGSIRSNVEKDASAKDSKSGGSKQSKSNRDLNKLCQEDKAGLSPNLSLPTSPFSGIFHLLTWVDCRAEEGVGRGVTNTTREKTHRHGTIVGSYNNTAGHKEGPKG
jgi:hypothetical protein